MCHPCSHPCLDSLPPWPRFASESAAYRRAGGIARLVRCLLLIAAFLSAAAGGAQAQELPAGLEVVTQAKVAAIVDGDTLELADGRQVRFVGIQAPKLPLGRPNFTAWPLAEEAKTAVETLLLGREVGLAFAPEGLRQDRYGRTLAHLVTPEGIWVQGRLLQLGLARVYSFPDNRALAADMLELERAARAAGRGIWSHPFYALRDSEPKALWPLLDSFQIVEGRITEVFTGSRNTYLNFGENWREDVSLQIGADAKRLFVEEGMDLTQLAGRRVRVRGWIGAYNGPLMKVTHPEQLEVLEP